MGEDISYGRHLSFTSCPDSIPHYHFVADNAKLSGSGMLIARNVFLHFGDVPVFWLPFLAQSTEQGRRSGLLPVRFSVNDIVRTSDTYSRRVSNIGYYWAINDYTDAQVGLDWWSGNYTGITGALQYRWQRMFQTGRAEFRQFWRENGGSELAFNANYGWEISERTRMRMRASYASSSAFVRENSFDPREITQSIDSEGGFDRRFDWGQLSVSGNRRQFLSDDRVEMTLPTLSLSLSTKTLFRRPRTAPGSTTTSRFPRPRAGPEQFATSRPRTWPKTASASGWPTRRTGAGRFRARFRRERSRSRRT